MTKKPKKLQNLTNFIKIYPKIDIKSFKTQTIILYYIICVRKKKYFSEFNLATNFDNKKTRPTTEIKQA